MRSVHGGGDVETTSDLALRRTVRRLRKSVDRVLTLRQVGKSEVKQKRSDERRDKSSAGSETGLVRLAQRARERREALQLVEGRQLQREPGGRELVVSTGKREE